MSEPVHANLIYVYEDVDRHGNVRIYFWRGKGHRKVRLREKPGTAPFYLRYGELMESEPKPTSTLARTPSANTFRWLCIKFFGSLEFNRLDPRTQYVRRRIFDSMVD